MQLVGRTLWHGDYILQLQILDRKIYDGGVLLNKEVILLEAFHVQHHVPRKPRQAVLPPPVLDVVMYPLPVVLLQDLKNWHLRWHTCAVTTGLFPDADERCSLFSHVIVLTDSRPGQFWR